MTRRTGRPNVLCLSGHDPTGGAGIQADIESVQALGGHAVTIITAHTAQDTRDVDRVKAPQPADLRRQLRVLLADVRVSAVKIGLIGHANLVPVIAGELRDLRAPVVLDPVLRAGGGRNLASRQLVAAIRASLLPQVDILTPNHAELARLAGGRGTDEDAAGRLLDAGARSVLVTGGDETGPAAVNCWYRPRRAPRRYAWPKLRARYHGAGCTLAAAIATLLARGFSPDAAVADAQAFTHRALRHAIPVGRGRRVPGRHAQP